MAEAVSHLQKALKLNPDEKVSKLHPHPLPPYNISQSSLNIIILSLIQFIPGYTGRVTEGSEEEGESGEG